MKLTVLDIAIALLTAAYIGLAIAQFAPRDDTDSPDTRSEMKPLTDYATGCQYLVSQYGMTPRLDSDGKPRCGRRL